jgi:dolichol-phosphate mannosyltransferase
MKYSSKKVSVIIAAKNEGKGLRKIILSVRPYSSDILVIDGHSTDDTKAIAKSLGVRYVLDHGLGRGDAVRMGIQRVKKDIIVLFDADGSHNPKDIPKLVLPILERKAELVFGSRRTGGSFDATISISGMIRSTGADVLTYLVNKRFGSNLTDILYSFRAIRTSTAKQLRFTSTDFSIEQEMVISCLRSHVRVLEIPSREMARGWGVSKLRTVAGIKLFMVLLKQLFSPA